MYSVSNIRTPSEGTTFLAAGMQETSNSAYYVILKKELHLYSVYILEQMLYLTGTKPQNMKVLSYHRIYYIHEIVDMARSRFNMLWHTGCFQMQDNVYPVTVASTCMRLHGGTQIV